VKGEITDPNGNFTIEVTDTSHTIKVSFVSFESQSFKVNSRSHIDIELKEKSMGIEEVVVVASSSANPLTGVHERDQTGSMVKVDMEDLSSVSGISAAEALQGQVAGLDIVSSSGEPGSGSSIVIRGMGSLGNNNPLIVVDGIDQNIQTQDFNFSSADQHDLGQLLGIAPQDIKSVEVLKDAVNTASWGSKGANGVILIETKKGSKGRIKFNYQYRYSMNKEPSSIPLLNGDEYITMQLEQWHNKEGVYDIPDEIAYNRDFDDFYNYSANTDWIKEITQTTYNHDHTFQFSGGGEKSTYFNSINYQKEFGTLINTSFQRFSARTNFDYNISDKLRLTTLFNYTNTNRENNPSNIRNIAYKKAPNMSIWEYDENGKLTGEYFTPIESYQGSGTSMPNPVALANLGINDTRNNQIDNTFKLNYFMADWVTFRQSINISFLNSKNNSFIPSSAIGADWLDNNVNLAKERNQNNIRLFSRSQLFITPFKRSNLHDLTGIILWEMEDKTEEKMFTENSKGPSIYITDPAGNAPVKWINSNNSQFRSFGALASLNYKYKDTYILYLNLRGDANSAFGKSNQWGLFPSVGFAWRFSKEPFMQSLNFLNDSKLRIGWGQTGNAPSGGSYITYANYESTGKYLGNTAIVPQKIQLTSLKWETSTELSGGLDINLFNYRLGITIEAYNKVTTDLLWPGYNIPGSSGYLNLVQYNGGEIQNTGIDYQMSGTAINRKDFQVILNFNINRNINRFLSFPDNFNVEKSTDIGNGKYPRKAEIGRPVGSFYGFRYLGVYPSTSDAIARDEYGEILYDGVGNPIPMSYMEVYNFRGGDAIYQDINHDGKIDIMDAVYIGDSSPGFTGGFGSTVKYKQFTMAFQFFYRLDFDIVNQTAIELEGMNNRNNQSTAVLRRWRREGQNEKDMIPRAYMDHP
ncbi:MAG: SusC/RagA family TonB-linked outer membrane protein, partial [bacterium]